MKKAKGVKFFDPEPDPRAHRSAQPSLFNQKQVKPTDQHRYQRGFTPDRMEAVTESMKDWRRKPDPMVDTMEKRIYGERPAPTISRLRGPGALRAHVKETIARSTMPLAPISDQTNRIIAMPHAHPQPDLSNTLGLTTTRTQPNGLSRSAGMSEVSIHYRSDPLSDKTRVTSPMGKPVPRREVFGSTVIHELGHVTQYHKEPVSALDKSVGQHERYADQFMVKHFRPDPREVRRGTHLDPRDFTYPANGVPAPGYRNWNRDRSDAIDRKILSSRQTMPPRLGRNQQPLFEED